MIVYNITIKVDWAISDEWLAWQQQEHIPEIMATLLFDQYVIYRLLEQDDTEGPTFFFQYFTSSPENYQQFIYEFAPVLRKKAFDKWGGRLIAFRTVMQAVN
jgi:hypothetical protein